MPSRKPATPAETMTVRRFSQKRPVFPAMSTLHRDSRSRARGHARVTPMQPSWLAYRSRRRGRGLEARNIRDLCVRRLPNETSDRPSKQHVHTDRGLAPLAATAFLPVLYSRVAPVPAPGSEPRTTLIHEPVHRTGLCPVSRTRPLTALGPGLSTAFPPAERGELTGFYAGLRPIGASLASWTEHSASTADPLPARKHLAGIGVDTASDGCSGRFT